jgi:hypothetical protein
MRKTVLGVGLLLTLVLAVAVGVELPSIRRYLRIKAM